jgi:hypothetical protein
MPWRTLDSPIATDEPADNEHGNVHGSALNDARDEEDGGEDLEIANTAEEVSFPRNGEAAQHTACEEQAIGS